MMGGTTSVDRCSVCSLSRKGKTLSCGHIFHESCIDEWINDKGNCPVCRRPYNSSAIANFTESSECSICLEYMSPIKTLPCEHEFHISCIYGKTSCPLCNQTFEEIQPPVCLFCSSVVHSDENKLNCGHSFHKSCISHWLTQYNSCPECSTPVDPDKLSLPPFNCSVCIKKIIVKEKILPCGHRFHDPCVAQYVLDCNSCPACLKPVDPNKPVEDQSSCSVCNQMMGGPGEVLVCGHKSHLSCYKTLPDGQKSCQECLAYNASLEEANIKNLCLFCTQRLESTDLTLPCGHIFHGVCAASWLRDEKICPECLVSVSDANIPLPEISATSTSNNPTIASEPTSNTNITTVTVSPGSIKLPDVHNASSTSTLPNNNNQNNASVQSLNAQNTHLPPLAFQILSNQRDSHAFPFTVNSNIQNNQFTRRERFPNYTSAPTSLQNSTNPQTSTTGYMPNFLPIYGNTHSGFVPIPTQPFQAYVGQPIMQQYHVNQAQKSFTTDLRSNITEPSSTQSEQNANVQSKRPLLETPRGVYRREPNQSFMNRGESISTMTLRRNAQTNQPNAELTFTHNAPMKPNTSLPTEATTNSELSKSSQNQAQKSFTTDLRSNITEPSSTQSEQNANVQSKRPLLETPRGVSRREPNQSFMNRGESISTMTLRRNAQTNQPNAEQTFTHNAPMKPNTSLPTQATTNSELSKSSQNSKPAPRRSFSLEKEEEKNDGRLNPEKSELISEHILSSINKQNRINSGHQDPPNQRRFFNSNDNFGNQNPKDYQRRNPQVKTNLSQHKFNSRSLSSLPIRSSKLRPMVVYEEKNCDLCQNLIATNSVKIDCGHSFHGPCIASWKKNQKVCPKCREPILEVYRNEANAIQGISNKTNNSDDESQSSSSEEDTSSGTEDESDDDKERLKSQIAELKLKDRLRERRVQLIEEENRKKNLIFRGFKGLAPDSYRDSICYFCSEVLGIDVSDKIENVYAIGRKDLQNPQIKVIFSSIQDTCEVLNQCKRLKGTDFSVMRDYPKMVKLRRNKLLHCRYVILQNTDLKKVSVRDDVLFVNNRKFVWDDEEGLVGLDPTNEAFLKDLVGKEVWTHLKTFD